MPGILSQLVKRRNSPPSVKEEFQNMPVQIILKLPYIKTDAEKYFDKEISFDQYRDQVIFSDEGVGEIRKSILELKKIFAN